MMSWLLLNGGFELLFLPFREPDCIRISQVPQNQETPQPHQSTRVNYATELLEAS